MSATVGDDLSSLLDRVAVGDISPSAAASHLAPLLVSGGAVAENVGGFAKIDHDRGRRVGFPEVIFGEGKSASQVVDILNAMIRKGGCERGKVSATAADVDAETRSINRTSFPIVATRISPEKWSEISASELCGLRYHPDARIVSFGGPQLLDPAAVVAGIESPTGLPLKADAGELELAESKIGNVAVLSAGTSDLAVAEEAAVLAELAGASVRRNKKSIKPVCLKAGAHQARASLIH